MIRDFAPADASAAVALLHRLEPLEVVTEASLLHGLDGVPERARSRYWAADGAFARARLGWETGNDEAGLLWAGVLPEARSRGLGSALLDAAEAHLADAGARELWIWAHDDSAGFLERRGYVAGRGRWTLRLDLPVALEVQPPPGIRLLPLGDVEPEAVHRLDSAAALDGAGDPLVGAMEYEEWLRGYWAHPKLDHAAGVAALADGEPVSFTMLERAGPLGNFAFTGTHPAWRGRGLAVLVKSAAIRRAGDRGLTSLTTSNDAENLPMLAVNERLGFRRVERLRQFIRTI